MRNQVAGQVRREYKNLKPLVRDQGVENVERKQKHRGSQNQETAGPRKG